MVPSLLTAGIRDEEPQTRATSSMTMQVATESAPWPSYSSGDVDGVEPGVHEGDAGLLGEACVLVDFLRVGCDLLLGERADRGPQFVVLFTELEQIEVRISGHGALLAESRRHRV